MGRELPSVSTVLSAAEITAIFAASWPGGNPPPAALALMVAQSALECARWKAMRDWNYGGAKTSSTTRDWQYFGTTECLTPEQAAKYIAASTPSAPARASNGACDPGKVRVFFGPRHPMARFRAFESAADGATDYLNLIARKFPKAWEIAIKTGDATAYVRAIKAQGYFTGQESAYATALVSLQKEFLPLAKAPISVASIAPEKLALPGVGVNLHGTPVSVAPFAPNVPATNPGTRGSADFGALVLICAAAFALYNLPSRRIFNAGFVAGFR